MTNSLEWNICIAYSKENDPLKPSVIRNFYIDKRHNNRIDKIKNFY